MVDSRYDLPSEEWARSMREMYRMVEVGHISPYNFAAFEVKVTFGPDGQPGIGDDLTGLVRRDPKSKVTDYVDPERGGWITAPLDFDALEGISQQEAESQAVRLRVGLEDAAVGEGPAPPAPPKDWRYYEFVLQDGTRTGLIRRAEPFEVQRLTSEGWERFPNLERMFSVGVGGDQGDVAPVPLDEARRRIARAGLRS
jgi:hypothetical protein